MADSLSWSSLHTSPPGGWPTYSRPGLASDQTTESRKYPKCPKHGRVLLLLKCIPSSRTRHTADFCYLSEKRLTPTIHLRLRANFYCSLSIMNSARRISQRAPLSCLPCSKRKMRCSKTIPCTNCVRRKIPDQCTREAVLLSKDLIRRESDIDLPLVVDGGASPQTGPRTRRRQSTSPVDPEILPPYTATPVSDRESSVVHVATNDVQPRAPSGKASVAMEAADNLESLVWGSHEATTEVYRGRNRALGMQGSLSQHQEQVVLEFHQDHVAWTHNVLHMPTFIRECMVYHQTQALPEAGWLSLYYAVLSVCPPMTI